MYCILLCVSDYGRCREQLRQGRALAHAPLVPHRAGPGDYKKAERGYGPLAARLRPLQRFSATAGPQRLQRTAGSQRPLQRLPTGALMLPLGAWERLEPDTN